MDVRFLCVMYLSASTSGSKPIIHFNALSIKGDVRFLTSLTITDIRVNNTKWLIFHIWIGGGVNV